MTTGLKRSVTARPKGREKKCPKNGMSTGAPPPVLSSAGPRPQPTEFTPPPTSLLATKVAAAFAFGLLTFLQRIGVDLCSSL